MEQLVTFLPLETNVPLLTDLHGGQPGNSHVSPLLFIIPLKLSYSTREKYHEEKVLKDGEKVSAKAQYVTFPSCLKRIFLRFKIPFRTFFIVMCLLFPVGQTSDFPVILSLENHCGVEQQTVMARHLSQILGDTLLTTLLDGTIPQQLPSPQV